MAFLLAFDDTLRKKSAELSDKVKKGNSNKGLNINCKAESREYRD